MVEVSTMKFFLPLTFLCLLSPLAAQEIREPQRLHPSQSNPAIGPAIASDGNVSCAVWTEAAPTNFIWTSVSDGRGESWTAPIRLDSDIAQNTKNTQLDSVAVSGDFVYVFWFDKRINGTDSETFFTYSPNGGLSWAVDRRIDNGYPAGTQAVESVSMATSSPYVYLAMRVDGPSGNDEIWVSASDDDGLSFAPAVYISSLAAGTADAINVAITAEGATCHVTWCDDRQGFQEEEVWYQRSTDGGATWLAADVQLDSSPAGAGDAQSSTMVIAADGSNVAVSWQEERTSASNEELYFNVSQDGGNTWLANDVVVGNYDPLTDDVDFNSMALKGDTILFAWRDNRTLLDQVYAATTSDFGTTVNEVVINLEDDNTSPWAYAWDELLAISYAGGSTPQDHRVVISRDGGATFSGEYSLSKGLVGDTDETAIAFNEYYRNIIGVWQQEDFGTNHIYVGGFRPQFLDPITLTAGVPLNWTGGGYPESSVGQPMIVVISDATGSLMTPDGRDTGLANGPFFEFTTKPSNFIQGTILSDGSATTATVTLPVSLIGFTLHMIGVNYQPGVGPGPITTVQTATVM